MIDIGVEQLRYVYPTGVVAVDGVDLEIPRGERIALVGQNGSGKSSLVRHLNGLLRPTSGRVVVDGRDAAHRSVAQLAALVGLVFQDPDRQIFARSVRAEVAFGPRNLGRRGRELDDAVHGALEIVGLQGEEDTNPYDLGTSRRKLLALASVLAMQTPAIVLDEPTTGQDLRGVERVRAAIDAAASAGRTVIAISHDMRLVAETFDRIVVLRAGRVVLDGSPEAVFAQTAWPVLASTFLEPPLAARLAAAAGLDGIVTDEALVRALGGRMEASSGAAGKGS